MSNSKHRIVIVVEDSPSRSKVICMLLEGHGFTAFPAQTIEEAKNEVGSLKKDGILDQLVAVTFDGEVGTNRYTYLRDGEEPALIHWMREKLGTDVCFVAASSSYEYREDQIRAGCDVAASSNEEIEQLLTDRLDMISSASS